MEKTNFKENEILTSSKLTKFETGVYYYLEKVAFSKSGIVKDGLSILLESNKLKVESGYGYSTDGKLKILENDSEVDYETNTDGYLFIDEENNLDFIERELEPDPYLYIMKLKNVLMIAILLNNEILPLNRERNIPKFPIGTMILSSNNNFKDFISLRGCRKINELNDYFIRFKSSTLEFENKTILMLNEENIPSLTLNGMTEVDGEHTHTYEREADLGSMWDSVLGNTVGHKMEKTSLDGGHEHRVNAVFNGISSPFSLEPSSVSLIGIVRIY